MHTDPVGREVGPTGEASCEASSDDGHPAGVVPEVRLIGDAIDIDPAHDGASGGGPLVGLLPVKEDELLGVVGVRPDEPPDKVIVGRGVHTHVELNLDACGRKRRDVGRRSRVGVLLDRAAVRGERPRRSRTGSPLVGEVEGEGGVRALVAELCRAELIAAITGVEAAVVALFVGVNHTVTTDREG